MKIDPQHDHRGQPIAQWAYLVHEVARLLKRRFEEEARSFGLTLPQWRALAQISLARDSSQAAIAAALDADPMTVSGILDRLEKRGLITRFPDPDDSRVKLTKVTPEGAELVTRARDVGRIVFDAAMVGVAEKDRLALVRALGCVRENLLGDGAQPAGAGGTPEKELN